MLSKNKYLEVIKETTLTSVDLILINNNKIFLGWRNNQPAKNTWFTPGVRTYKNETQQKALERLAVTELNIKIDTNKCKLMGVYDHIYHNNFRNEDFGTHYVVTAYIYKLNDSDKNQIKTDSQHDKTKWIELSKLLDDDKVHQYVKNYYPQILKIL
jgi:colanic acid biosynthesis protein WcaH